MKDSLIKEVYLVQLAIKDATRNARTLSTLSAEPILFNTLCFKMKETTNRKKFGS
jgi:hypothetical protein